MDAQGVVFTDRRKVEWQQLTVPDPCSSDVVVRLQHSWISNGTEGSFLRGERVNGETPYQEGDPWPFPLVPGYQKTGVVERIGKDVKGIREGDRVFATMSRVGQGFYMDMGGHVSPAVTPQDQIWPIPDSLSTEAVSGLVLLQVGYNCGTIAPIEPGETALVIGDGLVGQWTAQTLMMRGANVILAGRHDERLDLFARRGGQVIHSVRENPAEKAGDLAHQGIAYLADTVGSVQALETYLPLMKRRGQVVSAGFHGSLGNIDIQRLRFGELSLHAPSGWSKERMDEALKFLVDGQLDTTSLITHRLEAHRAPEGYRLILEKTEPVLGVVLSWM